MQSFLIEVLQHPLVFGSQCYKTGPLPPDALHAFKILQQQLVSDPVMAFPRADRQYALITDAATGTANSPGGLGAILTQIDKQGLHHAISFASRQLKDHEKNYSPFLLEAAAAMWGMDILNEYPKGKQFILYKTTNLWKYGTYTHQEDESTSHCITGG